MSSLLDQDLKFLPGCGPRRTLLLSRELGLHTWGDLLEYYPYKYVDRSHIYPISSLSAGAFVQIRGRLMSFEEHAMGARKRRIVAHLSDGTGFADIVWWNGGAWVYDHYAVGEEYLVFGRPTLFNARWQFANPDISPFAEESSSSLALQPYYITTDKMKKAGLMSRQVARLMHTCTSALVGASLPETLPRSVIASRGLVSRRDALVHIHFPASVAALSSAQLRLKFEELFYVQLNILRYAASRQQRYCGFVFSRVGEYFHTFYYKHLPFSLTAAQQRVVRELRHDVGSGRQMNRLLQGDVGSGKTLVALLAMLLAVDNGYQSCLLAPTELLAEQHVRTLQRFLDGMGLRVSLLTGAVRGRARSAVLSALASGEIHILVGTHAILEEGVSFQRLGLAVIDEQHRFGVAQRARLWRKNSTPPHILVMTATPIPRTLAMTLYGDLSVSVIDELPPGRHPIATAHLYDDATAPLYRRLHAELSAGHQVYAVFPLIAESEKSDLKNLDDGYRMLCERFPSFSVGMVHGKMKSAEKEAQMSQFVAGGTQLLVSTTVIEVGVDVPTASVMVIFDAHRFGLSQLHQLRGRVGRGAAQSYCFLVTPRALSKDTLTRMDIMCETNDGFRLAEVDLKLRGPGDLEGTQQSGMLFDLKLADLARDGALVAAARAEAQKIVSADPSCSSPDYLLCWQRLAELRRSNINWAAIS